MRRDQFSYIGKIAVISFVYIITATFGLKLDAVSGFATFIWIPTGISLAILFLFGFSLWPAIFFGAFIANLTAGATPQAAIGIGIGNTLEAIIGRYILKKRDFHPAMNRLHDVFSLLLYAAPASTLISATVGTLSLLIGGLLSEPFFITWTAWWVGDTLSNIIIASFLFVWCTHPNIHLKNKRRALEAIFFVCVLVLVSFTVFHRISGFINSYSPILYLVFPPLIWVSIRFSQREAVSSIFVMSAIAIWSTIEGLGPFAKENLSESFFYLESFLSVISITTMILSAVVSERKQFEQRKDDFISMASHELKTPLTSTKAFIQMLGKTSAVTRDKKAFEYVNRINNQINRLTTLISDMLDVSKIEAGKLILRKERFLLDKMVEETVEDVQTTSETHSIIFRGASKKQFYGDRERLAQALTNLLSNAIKYSPHSNKVIVDIKTESDSIIISVKDYGVGIPLEYQNRIFERFYRVKERRTVQFGGLGMGLSIALDIVKRHGGSIWVESKKDKGSSFYISLPIAAV